MSELSSEITDAVSQTDVKVIAESPAMSLGTSYQTSAHSTGLMFENAVGNQQQQFNLFQSGTAQEVHRLYGQKVMAEALQLVQLLRAGI